MNEDQSQQLIDAVAHRLKPAWSEHAALYPGELPARQPVHTVYGGAHLFRRDTARKLGDMALRFLTVYGPDAESFARATGLADRISQDLAVRLYERVLDKLCREPIEDFRIDFEDGFGVRPDDEEDRAAEAAAREVALGMRERTLPPFVGIRIKPLNAENHRRALRTLERFCSTLISDSDGALPGGFVITLPKIVNSDHVAALADALDLLEQRLGLDEGQLRLELMIETTQSIIGPDGSCPMRGMLSAARGRCVAAHFGVYDYTASCVITAELQHMRHPACDFARHFMQVALAGTGIFLSDGATNIMPAPPHRASPDQPLTPEQESENRRIVEHAWQLHMADIRHSLEHAFYQGWDLHPAQLPTRYAALYAFFLEGLDAASDRLRNFIDKAAQATLIGDVFDDAATGQGLLNFFLRGLNCGAITPNEAARTGLSLEELRMRSFTRILDARRASPGAAL